MGEARTWQPPAWAPPVLCLLTVTAMLAWNPDGWLHPLIDYGRELYVPWRLSAGETLYEDLAYFNGPLSPYLNAVWMALFGVSVHVLTAANTAIVLVACALLYRIIRGLADRLTATFAALGFLVLFAFQHLESMGNYNWLAPYSHEVPHGVTLALWTTLSGCGYVRRGSRHLLISMGLALGLTFLTKPEIFAAAACAAAVALAVRTGCAPVGERHPVRHATTLAAATLVPPLLAGVLLATAMPLVAAMQGVFGGWVYVLHSDLTSLRFYALTRGTEDVPASLLAIGLGLGAYTLALLPAGVLALRRRAPVTAGPAVGIAAVGATALYAVHLAWGLPWESAFRPLLVSTLAIAGGLLLRTVRTKDPSVGAALVVAALALGMLPKIVLNVTIHHYGFGLTVAAAALSITALLFWLPRWIAARGGSGEVFRAAAGGLLVGVFASVLTTAGGHFANKSPTEFAHETLSCRSTRYLEMVRTATEWLAKNSPPTETVVVLPEGISINYLTRRRNPSGHVNFMPPEFVMFGEAAILRDLRAAPPDLIVLLHRPTREYGLPRFGTHYATSVMAWVRSAYRPVHQIEKEPNTHDDPLGGMWILRRRG